jgi:hypothetical protein
MNHEKQADELVKKAKGCFDCVLLSLHETQNEHDLVDAYNFSQQACQSYKSEIAQYQQTLKSIKNKVEEKIIKYSEKYFPYSEGVKCDLQQILSMLKEVSKGDRG